MLQLCLPSFLHRWGRVVHLWRRSLDLQSMLFRPTCLSPSLGMILLLLCLPLCKCGCGAVNVQTTALQIYSAVLFYLEEVAWNPVSFTKPLMEIISCFRVVVYPIRSTAVNVARRSFQVSVEIRWIDEMNLILLDAPACLPENFEPIIRCSAACLPTLYFTAETLPQILQSWEKVFANLAKQRPGRARQKS